MLHGRSAIVQLVSTSGNMRLVASIDPDEKLLTERATAGSALPMRKTLSSGDIPCEHDAGSLPVRNGRRMYTTKELQEVRVPLNFHGDTWACSGFFIPCSAMEGRDDLMELSASIVITSASPLQTAL